MSELAGSIRRDLYAIVDNYDAALDPARRASDSQVKASKEPPLPIGAHILDIRAEVAVDLAYWARFLLDEVRDVNGETLQHGPTSTHIDELVPFVVRWVDWLLEYLPDDAENLAADARKHARALRGVVQGLGSRKFPIGPCIEHGVSDMGERIPCPGEMTAVLRREDELLPSEIVCTVDNQHHWAASDWMRLGRRIIEGMSA